MGNNQLYSGIVKTGRGGATKEMSTPGGLEGFRLVTGLDIVPGTLNIDLIDPFDLSLLNYLKFADVGWVFNPATQGIEYDGEIGMYYGRALVTGEYPACLIFFTWVTEPDTDAELVSPHHLRTVLNLKDGDEIKFTLANR